MARQMGDYLVVALTNGSIRENHQGQRTDLSVPGRKDGAPSRLELCRCGGSLRTRTIQ